MYIVKNNPNISNLTIQSQYKNNERMIEKKNKLICFLVLAEC